MSTKELTWLDENPLWFPNSDRALSEPNGLLAAGGDLTVARLLTAYQRGIFPWFSEGQPILWWSPNPRLVLKPTDLYLTKSFKKFLRKNQRNHTFRITVNECFERVIDACSESRNQPRDESFSEESDTWITDDMQEAYIELHHKGYAHSIETWQENRLVGGLYGIAIGKVFFGESMFSRVSNASKIAFVTLVQQLKEWDYNCIDCQVKTEHLSQFGANEISRFEFENILQASIPEKHRPQNWKAQWTQNSFGLDLKQ